MVIYWKLNHNKCDLTVQVNKLCNWSEEKYFNDFFNILSLKQYRSWNNIYHKIFLIFGICIAIYKLIYY